jgi:beta-phosphoglucomutase family hydrolase
MNSCSHTPGTGKTVDLTGGRFDAVLFDLDGVLTDTARVHAASWKKMFDAYLKQRAAATGEPFRPFEMEDYRLYVDGKPRADGVRDFLTSRGITLPLGSPEDPPDRGTVCGLGNRKNELVIEAISTVGVDAYPGSVALVRYVLGHGLHTAVVSASANCAAVLEAAQIADLFEARVDGTVLKERQLRGKPEPDSFLEAARELGVEPRRAVVVEDAIAGVRAGRAGAFGLVVGVSRKGDEDALAENGADIVVHDLAELVP